FYPLLDHDYTISFQNILDCRKKINNITETIKTLVEKILANRKYEIGFMCYLMKIFRLKAPFIFHARNRPMIYCKPLFLLFPLWIEDTIQKELTLAKHLFNISLILNVTKAIMKYNYECLKPFFDKKLRESMQVGFSYHFCCNKCLMYNHFNLIIEFLGDIFTMLGEETYQKVLKYVSGAGFLSTNCDNVFTKNTSLEIPVILFDVFILLSKENFEFLHSIICDYEVLKESLENKDLKFVSYIKKTLNEESYLQNENCRKLYYNLVSIYERVFLGIPYRGSEYRLIPFNTKCVTKVVQLEVERRVLLAENQLGALALLNIALNKEYRNNLKATWIDVKKAYDSIDHAYLTQCIENLNLPDRILKFIKKIYRGILQGDSLSPLLFVLCMDPLSRNPNEKNTKVTVQTDAEINSTNHILFIDDLKLLAKDSSSLSAMTGEAKEFLEVIGLEINKEKSAQMNRVCVYKYLGIIEDSRGIPTRSSFEEVQSKLISRVERFCHTRLIAENLFSAINQHAISLINYHIGLDDVVRAELVKNKIHLRPGCKECLYLSRTELGRGLHSVELRCEHMLLELLDCLEKVENNNKTHLSLIKNFLKIKYRLEEEFTKKKLEEAQLANLYNEIERRKLHANLYNARKNELVCVSDSSRWLKRVNIRLRDEAVFCYIQDRNIFEPDCVCQHSGNCHSVQEIPDNEYTEIRLKRKTLKYDLLAIKLGLIYQCSVEIIPYVMTWDGIVTKYHKSTLTDCKYLIVRVEIILFDRRRRLEPGSKVDRANDENDDKEIKTKNNTPPISKRGTGHKHKSRVGFRRRDGCSKRKTNLPLLSNFSISNFAEQPLSRYNTNDTALGSYNHQVVSEAINSCQESPSNNHAGIITPEQDHMQNHSASIHTYMVLNKDKEVVFETKNHAIFKIIGSLCRKDVIRRLEYFYPLIEGEYTISIENILHYRKRINDISDAIKSHVEKLSNIRNYE
ncbi:reverse transcriptase, partial [Hamiltosporidium tvaerminnensis]